MQNKVSTFSLHKGPSLYFVSKKVGGWPNADVSKTEVLLTIFTIAQKKQVGGFRKKIIHIQVGMETC